MDLRPKRGLFFASAFPKDHGSASRFPVGLFSALAEEDAAVCAEAGTRPGLGALLGLSSHSGWEEDPLKVIPSPARLLPPPVCMSDRANPVPSPDLSLTIAVVDPSRARAAVLEEGLRGLDGARVVVIPDTVDLLDRLSALSPDVVVIHLESPSRDLLEQMFGVSRLVEKPVAMFVDRSDTPMMQAAVDAGISAYIVDGLKADRIKPIIEIAILRFNAFARLQRELAEARNELADRKLIDRAKGILMSARGLSEDEAYKQMRRKAMNEKRKIIDIARAIVTAADLLG